MLDKTDKKILSLLQKDCMLSLQSLADATHLTTTPCWKRLKRLEDENIIQSRVALVNKEKLGLKLTAFMLVKTQQHNSHWYKNFTDIVQEMPEVMAFYRMAGEYDYLLHVLVANMSSYDDFYKKLVKQVPGLINVTSCFAMEEIKCTTELPLTNEN